MYLPIFCVAISYSSSCSWVKNTRGVIQAVEFKHILNEHVHEGMVHDAAGIRHRRVLAEMLVGEDFEERHRIPGVGGLDFRAMEGRINTFFSAKLFFLKVV